jgi:hypothetical protein
LSSSHRNSVRLHVLNIHMTDDVVHNWPLYRGHQSTFVYRIPYRCISRETHNWIECQHLGQWTGRRSRFTRPHCTCFSPQSHNSRNCLFHDCGPKHQVNITVTRRLYLQVRQTDGMHSLLNMCNRVRQGKPGVFGVAVWGREIR